MEVLRLLSLARDLVAGKPLVRRSAKWPALRAAWLKDHPQCEGCGGTKHLEVHHKRPEAAAKVLSGLSEA